MPEFDRSDPVTVAVQTNRGSVDIVAEDRTTVVADVVPLDRSDASRSAAEAATVALEGNTLVVQAPEAGGWQLRRSPNLAVTVRVPTGSSLAVRTASADVRAHGQFATAEVRTASGDVRIDEVTGDTRAESASGDLQVGRIGGALRIATASGDLDVGDVTGDVSSSTASGDMVLRRADGSVDATTASGDIRIGVVRQGRTGVRSASGDVEVGVAAGTGVWLDLNTMSGSTRSDLTMSDDGPDPAAGAALELRVQTLSGDIHVRRASVPAAV